MITHLKSAIGDSPQTYFARKLTVVVDDSVVEVDESSLLKIVGPKIVLGEPGMGKSELISEIGRLIDVQPISAARFMSSKRPEKFVVPGRPLLIDGLDEAMARREGDAIDDVLAQLEDAGAPDFILSCRIREWQSRTSTTLRKIYGVEPILLTIEPLNWEDATRFLAQRFPQVSAENIINHLEINGISDLYSNPLTLSLMGEVAKADAELPNTRASLFERVCGLIWPEHDPERSDTKLAVINNEQALSAAGALMAGLLLSGCENISLAVRTQVNDGEISISDLEVLPGTEVAREIFSSKLFRSVGVGRAKPLHRVIAEYLGARWLSSCASSARRQRRILAIFSDGGPVPASLR